MSDLVRLLTDSTITVARIKSELSQNGISSITKNGFQAGAMAGFGGGAPDSVDLFISPTDMEQAQTILKNLIN
jgi:hypothetical protein